MDRDSWWSWDEPGSPGTQGTPSLLHTSASEGQPEPWAAAGHGRPGETSKAGGGGVQRMSKGVEESQGKEEGAWEALI